MKKKLLIVGVIVVILVISTLLILPNIVIYGENKVTFISYSDDWSRFEENACYDENYFYYEDLDISINDFEVEKKFFLYFITLGYEEGNVCETEYVLEEEYINNFLAKAVIEENNDNVDVSTLIEGKTAIVGNNKYYTEDDKKEIYYTLDGEYNVMYIFEVDDLLVFQVGNTDEGPKFIAYK